MSHLNEEESKELLRKKVFGEDDFPPQLREAAEKIVLICEGLPLMIVTVADLISKANYNDPLYWNEVAKRQNSVFMDAYNQISQVLFPTYDVFPQHVKMILIYAGAFHQDQKIFVPRLIDSLIAERFSELQNLKKNVDEALNEFGWKCGILDLQKYMFYEAIRVYSWWMHLFNVVASKDKFFGILTSDFRGDDGSNPLCCLDHISTLKNLEELGCSVTNPEVKYEFVAPPTLSMFPSSLQKLNLSGLGYSWKHMKVIGSLPNLQVLYLGCNAFRGPKWGTKRKSFLSLKSLEIEDCDVLQWKPRCGSFPKLERLRISHCYKLKEVY